MMDTGGDGELIPGHSTADALRILHDELLEVLAEHQSLQHYEKWGQRWQRCFLHHGNRQSPFHWTGAAILVLMAVLLFVAYAYLDVKDTWLVVAALVLLILTSTNCYYLGWDDQLTALEMVTRAKAILRQIDSLTKNVPWSSSQYIQLHAPFSPCVTLQWTYRDGEVINLPCCFLVEGDIILLRPGQEVPARCRLFQMDEDEEICEFMEGELYSPDMAQQADKFFQPQARTMLQPRAFIILETPFTKNLKLMLKHSTDRPVSVVNNERYQVYTVWIERRFLPAVLLMLLLTNVVRYILMTGSVGHWADMLIVRQIHGILPLTALGLPVIWKVLDMYGLATILVLFNKSKAQFKRKNSIEAYSSTESLVNDRPPVTWSWQEVFHEFKLLMVGNADTLPRTANVVHVLGSVTSFCCVDKKGVLSWPNPTPEKVFFLRSDPLNKHSKKRASNCKKDSTDEDTEAETEESDEDEGPNMGMHNPGTDYMPDTTRFEVMDLTPDAKNGYGLQFDDPKWKRYLSSLKPLGLNILLNTCNTNTVERYTQFADHVSCASLKQELAVPVVNRRCFCALAHEIGFSEQAMDIFQACQSLGIYRHVSEDSRLQPRFFHPKSAIRYRMPMPNMFSVVAKEIHSGMLQLMSQGTADVLLDSCTDFWNGRDLCPLGQSQSDHLSRVTALTCGRSRQVSLYLKCYLGTHLRTRRKKILDFYHRYSMSSYCTAFSYCPLTQSIASDLYDIYVEVPNTMENVSHIKRSPSPIRHWGETHSLEGLQTGNMYHGSVDSLVLGPNNHTIHDVDGCYKAQSSQIFIGLITMQYQAKQDIVQLIEDLETACIRFVHFSKENELRSRVFSEKMGLEAGWNCHISLQSEDTEGESTSPPSQHDLSQTNTTGPRPSNSFHHSAESVTEGLAMASVLIRPNSETRQSRRCSAPSAISVDTYHVKFEPENTIEELSTTSSTPEHLQNKAVAKTPNLALHHTHSEHIPDTDDSDRRTPLLADHVDVTSLPSPGVGENLSDPLLQHGENNERPNSARGRRLSSRSSGVDITGGENLSSSESYPASSHITENTDSVTGFGLSNRAKLPRGIENIRSHIDNVDNVPLLVSLFTDCRPDTTQEMLAIMQEYGEVVCCLGSSANIFNTGLFLKADCSLAVEPLYTQVCMNRCAPVCEVMEEDGPMVLSMRMHSLPCSLAFQRDDHISIIQLMAMARGHLQNVRSGFLLLLMLQLTLVLVQTLGCVLLLPPLLATHHVLWLSIIAAPALSLSLIANPLDQNIMQVALGKNKNHLMKQSIVEFVLYFCVSFVPTVIVCLLCYVLTMSGFCQQVVAATNTTCYIIYGVMEGAPGDASYNGWLTDYSSGLALAQNFTALQLLIYNVFVSLCYVHRFHHLWQRTPLVNRLWCITVPVLIVLQFVYFAIDMVAHGDDGTVQFTLHDVPLISWLLAGLWPLLLLPLLELIKRREIKLSVRFQKRARLDFGTKLGMNSPF